MDYEERYASLNTGMQISNLKLGRLHCEILQLCANIEISKLLNVKIDSKKKKLERLIDKYFDLCKQKEYNPIATTNIVRRTNEVYKDREPFIIYSGITLPTIEEYLLRCEEYELFEYFINFWTNLENVSEAFQSLPNDYDIETLPSLYKLIRIHGAEHD